VVGRVRSIEKPNDLIGNRTCDLAACSVVPQAATLPRAQTSVYVLKTKCSRKYLGLRMPIQSCKFRILYDEKHENIYTSRIVNLMTSRT
jgi:hypothetical protein